MKKSSSVEIMAALLTLKEELVEDTTTCAASSDPSSTSEKTSQNGHANKQNEDTDYQLSHNEDADSHEAVYGIGDDTMNKINDEQASKGVCQIPSDIPISIIPISSSHGDRDDDCSNDTVSTLGVDSALNDNPRSIFSNYWDGQDLKNIPATVLSKSSSRCTSATSLSVASSAINSNAPDTISLAHRMEREMHVSGFPRHDSIKSDIDEYEIALRGYERGRTTIPRAAALNDQRNSITKTSVMGGQLTKTENGDILPNQKQHDQPSDLRRHIFSNKYSSQLPYCRSTSALTQQQRYRSCLRPLGRSLSAVVQSEITDGESEVGGKVTFAPNVKILEYGRPHTIQASSRGWSKYFV